MSHHRSHIAALVLIALLFCTLGTAAAKGGNGHPKAKPKARITWSQPRVVQGVTPGQTSVVELTLTSSADLGDVTLRIPGGLGNVVRLEPAAFARLKAGVPAKVRLTIAMPAQNAHSQAGIVQVRSGKRAIPASLKVKLTVPGPSGVDEDVH
jgi:hypothetical protein